MCTSTHPCNAHHHAPDPLAPLYRWQPDLLGDRVIGRKDQPPPVPVEALCNCITTEVWTLSAMTHDQRQRLPRETWLGAIYYYLRNPGNDNYMMGWAREFARALKVEACKRRQSVGLALTRLDIGTTTVDHVWRDSAAQHWRFRGVSAERAQWCRVMPQCESSIASVLRTLRCGQGAIVKRHVDGTQYAVESYTCGKRTCPVCAIRHKLRTMERLQEALAGPWHDHDWRFITLTLRAMGRSLSDQITHLTKSFRRLRQQQIWLRSQQDGIGVIEIKWSQTSQDWHVHLHILARGSYIPKDALSAAWLQATGDSMIVDIRAVTSREGAINYLCKYIGKPPTAGGVALSDDLLGDWYVGIKRRRMMIGYGAYKSLPQPPDEVPDDPLDHQWEWYAPLDQVLRAQADGDPSAILVMRALEGYDNAKNKPPWFDGS